MSSTIIPATTPSALTLRVNFAWSLMGNIVQAASQWGVVVLLARLTDPSTVGSYALALSIVSPVFLLTNLHLRAVQSTDMQGEFPFESYFSLRVLTTISAVILLSIASCFAQRPLSEVLLGLSFAKAFESMSELLYGKYQKAERMDQIGRSMMLRSLATLAVIGIGLSLGFSLPAVILTSAAIAAAVAIYDLLGLQIRISGWKCWDPALALQLARKAAPLGLILLLVSLNGNIPRYFLANIRSDHEVGIFSALNYVAIAANTLVMALGQASIPGMAKRFSNSQLAQFLRLGAPLVGLAAGLGVAGVVVAKLAGSEVLTRFYGSEYAKDGEAFTWMMVAAGVSFIASALGYLLSSTRCFKPQVPMLALTGVTIAFGCWLWVPSQGIRGAAMGLAAGYSLQCLLAAVTLAVCCWPKFKRSQNAA